MHSHTHFLRWSFHIPSMDKVQNIGILKAYMKINIYLCTPTHALTAQEAYLNLENVRISPSTFWQPRTKNSFPELVVSFTPSLLPLTVNIVLHLLSSWLQSGLHQKVRFNNFQYAGTCCTVLTVAFMSHTVPEDTEVLTARTSPPCWFFFPKSLHALLMRKMENTS